jgi:hypothetical protein
LVKNSDRKNHSIDSVVSILLHRFCCIDRFIVTACVMSSFIAMGKLEMSTLLKPMSAKLVLFKLHQSFLRCLPVAISVGIGVAIAPASGSAATAARSFGNLFLDGFSHAPNRVDVLADRQAIAIGQPGQVIAGATSDAVFNTDGSIFAANVSLSEVAGSGRSYSGEATSLAAVFGYDFKVGAGERFEFGFNGLLNVLATADNQPEEQAQAEGLISFDLYASQDDTPGQLIDSLRLFGQANATQPQAQFSLNGSQNFGVRSQQTAQQFNFTGQFSRQFDRATRLTLVEAKQNRARVKVPETSGMLPGFLLVVGLGALTLRKSKIGRNLLTR